MDIEFGGYKITGEPIGPKIPETLEKQLQSLYEEIQNPKPKTVDKIFRLIKKYPKNIQLKNYLVTTYSGLGRDNDARIANDKILREHPEYFFARLIKANEYLAENKFEEINDLLGKGINLQDIYPDREIFHITEFLSLQFFAVKYYLKLKDLVQAEIRLQMMADIDEDSPQYRQAQMLYKTFKFSGKAQEIFEREKQKQITPVVTFKPKKDYEFQDFELEETEQLYHFGQKIPDDFIGHYLSLNRKQLISDLENVLKRSYLKHKQGDTNYAPVHAFFMLGELEAKESLPVILEMMCSDEKYFDDVFGSVFTESGWIPLFRIGKNQLNLLEEYLKLPGLYTYFRSSATDALTQVALHYPERKDDVAEIFKNLLKFFVVKKPKDNIIDTEFNGFLVSDIIELEFQNLLPLIKELYEKRYVAETVAGTFKEVENDILNPLKYNFKRELLNIKEFYERRYPRVLFDDDDDDFRDQKIQSIIESHFQTNSQPDYYVREQEKIGRNDPCPCGSGKKFKKCCIGKGVFD